MITSARPSPNTSSAKHGRDKSAQLFLKRVLDVAVSAVALLLLLPFLAVLAILIKLDSAGPVFFTPEVIGRHGRRFRMLKFRSMRTGSQDSSHVEDVRANFFTEAASAFDADGKPVYKTALRDSSRITRMGRFLRKTSIDELPQLWNVLCGDMSIVGPRPSMPYEAELYEAWHMRRFQVRPGITGLYQITARNRVPIREMIRIDIDYVDRWSLALDLMIIAKTPLAMIRGA